MHAALLQEAAPETPSLDQSLQLLEFWRAGALQPFEQDHLAVDNVGPRLQQAGWGELAAPLGARADGVGDDEGFEALRLKIDRGLKHANMGLNASDHDLGTALPAKVMQPLAQRLAPQAGEFDLVDDEAGIGEGFADRIGCRA